MTDHGDDDPAFHEWEQATRVRREELVAPLEALRQRIRQRELDAARAEYLDPVLELDDGSVIFASELGQGQDHRVVAIRTDLSGPWDADEDQDDDGPPC